MRLRSAFVIAAALLPAAYPLGCTSDDTPAPAEILAGGAGAGASAGGPAGAMKGAAGAGAGGSVAGSSGAGQGGAGAAGDQGGQAGAGAGGEAGSGGGSGGGGGFNGPTYTNPVLNTDFPDPFVLADNGTYYAFSTNAGGSHVRVARSTDLATWQELPDALPELPPWALENDTLTWAPAVLKRGSQFVLYYTTRHKTSNFQCIGRARAVSPEGPYDGAPEFPPSKSPLVCQVTAPSAFCGSIDPDPFVDPASGKAYLHWKSDENASACAGAARLWAQELSADGYDVVGAPAVALLQHDQAWETPLIENPAMVYESGRYFLFYSANWYESSAYAVGYAECDGPRGPCAKKTIAGPLFQSAGPALGPGGASFFTSTFGVRFMAYHAWTAPQTNYPSGGARSLRLESVTFAGGAPVIAGPTTTPQALPSP
ncbi:MAG: glycoside hydrolase family 43 protein [Polyangiaceae bacterium]|jgi:hypothetical protein|nr:glycoside hydrolase family 43 protein [Polyangiaceae bacterium]